jgi:hypothetical protein
VDSGGDVSAFDLNDCRAEGMVRKQRGEIARF